MGSLVNWLSPMGKEVSNIRGRAFDLKTGTDILNVLSSTTNVLLPGEIHSTDVLYKHRLQMDGAPLTPKTPVETPQFPHYSLAALPVPASETMDALISAADTDQTPKEPVIITTNGLVMQKG
jgi:hypothetical protein